jgi:hypothetical protein
MSDFAQSRTIEGSRVWLRNTIGIAGVVAVCGLVQAWLAPGSRIETVPYQHGNVSMWKSVLEGHLRFPLTTLSDVSLLDAIEVGAIVAGTLLAGLLLWRAKDVVPVVREDLFQRTAPRARTSSVLRRSDAFIALGFLIAFGALHLVAGLALAESQAFQAMDILFENDTLRTIKDLAVAEAPHRRSQVHPLFVLLLNPVGSLIVPLVDSPQTAALLLNATLGALAVVLAYLFFRVRGGEAGVAALLALVFGLSASQLLFGAIPGTNALAACSLALTYGLFWLSLTRRRIWIWAWIAVGILSFGVTSTNFVQTFVCFVFTALALAPSEGHTRGRVIARALVLGTVVIAISAVLATAQQRLFDADPFYLSLSYEGENQNATLAILRQPLTVAVQLLKHMFLVDFVAPVPNVWTVMRGTFPAVTFASSWNYTAFGWAAAAVWITVLASGIRAFARLRQRQPAFVGGITACILFNLALHAVYGVGEKGKIEYFVYSGNFTFLVFVVASSSWLDPERPAGTGRLVLLASLLAINGVWIVGKLLDLYTF